MPEDVKSPGVGTATNGDGETSIDDDGWKSIPLPDVMLRLRNVACLHATGGDPTCVPPDFNSSMLEELWHSMSRSGQDSITVNTLLQNYKEHCRT